MRAPLSPSDLRALTQVRATRPHAMLDALRTRRRRTRISDDGHLFLIAADHPARGALAAGSDANAMADRHDLLQRLAIALQHTDGLLASADVIEDLAYLGLLHDKVVIGTTNRGGILGAEWELDDRLTAYDAERAQRMGLDGAKMLLRIARNDPGTARTLETCGQLVSRLNDLQMMAMVEPLPYELATLSTGGRRARLLKSEEQLLAAVTIASGLGASSAYTWLKLPAWSDPARMASATTLPVLLLGGDIETSLEASLSSWNAALHQPQRPLQGLVIGRTLLYPTSGHPERTLGDPHEEVARAVEATRAIVRPTTAPPPRPEVRP